MKSYIEKWKSFNLNESQEEKGLWALIIDDQLIELSSDPYRDLEPILKDIIEKREPKAIEDVMKDQAIESYFDLPAGADRDYYIKKLDPKEREDLKQMAIEMISLYDYRYEDAIVKITSFEQLNSLVKGNFSSWGKKQAEKFVKSALIRKGLF